MENFIEVPVAHRNLISNKILESSFSIIGAGHLGSWVANGLSLIGATEFYLYDFDIVESRNLSGTPYQNSTIGRPKVEALKQLMESNSAGKRFILVKNKKVEKTNDIIQNTEFYIIATDSLESRISIFNSLSRLNNNGFLIDMRSRAKISEIYAIPLDNEVARYWYKSNLESKKKDPTPPIHCNEANIVQNSLLAASIAIQVVSDVLDGNKNVRYFRIEINNFKIHEINVPIKSFKKEMKDKKKKRKRKRKSKSNSQVCQYCKKRHRKKALIEKCKEKNRIHKNVQLPDRSILFKK